MGKKKSEGAADAAAAGERKKAEAKSKEQEIDAASDDDDGSAAAGGVEESEELELLQVDLGDILKVKQVLDEATTAALVDLCDLKEDHRLENLKLTLMFVACCFAMVAQFAPIPFPESRFVLGGCCVLYFILSGVLQLIVTFVETDAIMTTLPPASGDFKRKDKGIRVRTEFPRFEEWYHVRLEYEGVKDSPFVHQKWSVGDFFDVEGMFDEVYFMEEVRKLVKRLEKGKYDKEEVPNGGSNKKKNE